MRENLHDRIEFGGANPDWERLKRKMQQGDELWYFAPPSKDAIQLWGLALVRAGEMVSKVVLAVD